MSWKIDSAHSKVGFAVRHMMISTVRGTFANPADVEISFDPANLSAAKVKASIDAASVDTGETARDNHLRSADFFDAEKHPKITFVSTSVKGKGGDVEVTGDLTIRGVTKPIVLQGEVAGPAKDPWGGQRVGFSLSGDIDREAWGLTWNQALEAGGVLVAKKVKLEIEVQLVPA